MHSPGQRRRKAMQQCAATGKQPAVQPAGQCQRAQFRVAASVQPAGQCQRARFESRSVHTRSAPVCSRADCTHRSRGSVRGKHPLRSEYIRGYHHAQSKLIYARKYQSTLAARQQQHKLLWQTALALFVRVLVPSPRHVARMIGRMAGLVKFRVADA